MSIKNTRWQRPLLGSMVALSMMAACGDSDGNDSKDDSGVQTDAGNDAGGGKQDGGDELDGGAPDASEDQDASTADSSTADSGVPAKKLTELFAAKAPLSATQADRFWSATFTSDNKVLAAGFVTEVVPNSNPVVLDRKFAVARFSNAGVLDKTFGDVDPADATKRTGIATVNVFAATTANDTFETAKGVAVQSDGKIIVAGLIETGKTELKKTPDGGTELKGTYAENELAVARFSADGVLDNTFSPADADGRPGLWIFNVSPTVVRITYNTMNQPGLTATTEDVGDVKVDSKDRVVLFAAGKSKTVGKDDRDRLIFRLTKDGAVDTQFASAGVYEHSTEGAHQENALAGRVLADDGIVSVGYTNPGAPMGNHRMVIVRLNAEGQPVTTFGSNGATYYNPFLNAGDLPKSGFAESYSAAVQSDGKLVTTGYGRTESTGTTTGNPQNAVMSVRFDVNGQGDQSYGADEGYTRFNQADGAADSEAGPEQGRNIIALPDDRLLTVGNATVAAGNGNGFALLLDKNGKPDTSFQGGKSNKSYDFGLNSDQLWGLDVSKDKAYVVAAGFAATSVPQGQTLTPEQIAQEDAALVIYKLED